MDISVTALLFEWAASKVNPGKITLSTGICQREREKKQLEEKYYIDIRLFNIML